MTRPPARQRRLALGLVLVLCALSACGGRPRPSVIVLNIDMLRSDHLGVHGYKRDTTPELDRLARTGVWFRQARAQSSWTYPSVVSLLTGLYPTSHGAGYSRDREQYVTTTLTEAVDTLPAFLRRHGYTTAAFVTNPLLRRTSGLARGFDVYEDDFVGELRRDRLAAPWWLESMTAENVHRRLLDWIDHTSARPFFAYVHYIDVHGPYLPSRPFGRAPGSVAARDAEAARLRGEPRDVAIDIYDGALRHLDGLIGNLLRQLDRRGVLEDCIVVVTADHGEEFGEHGGHGHGHTLYEELLHVPLIFARTAAFDHERTIDAPVAHIDLFPTIADLLELAPPVGLPGTSLRPPIEGTVPAGRRTILAEMDIRGRPAWNAPPGALPLTYALLEPPSTKYVLSLREPLRPGAPHDPTALEAVFDLARDPAERTNLAAAADTARLRGLLVAELARAAAGRAAPVTLPIDPETRERLRALGYAD